MPVRTLIALALAAPAALWAQVPHAGGAMATREVSQYLARERELQTAVVARDVAAVEARVAPDFTYRSPASPDVLDRDAWLKREPRKTALIRDLTVREQDGVAVVSFVAGRRFVVDLWKNDMLVARSASLASDAAPAPKRPDSRE